MRPFPYEFELPLESFRMFTKFVVFVLLVAGDKSDRRGVELSLLSRVSDPVYKPLLVTVIT